jgi:hypothetical protein
LCPSYKAVAAGGWPMQQLAPTTVQQVEGDMQASFGVAYGQFRFVVCFLSRERKECARVCVRVCVSSRSHFHALPLSLPTSLPTDR